jgi:hypothetical protein
MEISDPFTIYVLCKEKERDNAQVASLLVDLADLFYCNSFLEDLSRKKGHLRNTGASEAQVNEFKKIRELFGV